MGLLKSKKVKIKKTHKCLACGGIGHKGDKMQYIVGIWEGDFSAHYWCKYCHNFYVEECDNEGILPGDFKDEPKYEEYKVKMQIEEILANPDIRKMFNSYLNLLNKDVLKCVNAICKLI